MRHDLAHLVAVLRRRASRAWQPTWRAGRERLARFARATTTSMPACRALVRRSATPAGCDTVVPKAYGGACRRARRRGRSAWRAKRSPHVGLADFAFAMQGLGSGAITLAGTPTRKGALSAARRDGRGDRRVCAVRAGSGIRCRGDDDARAPRRRRLVLDGEKTWISNGGIADFYVRVRAHRRGQQARAASRAFVVPTDAPG